MSFTLRWKNPNVISTVVNIYRDTKDILVTALPAPIATLTNGETEWRDNTALPGGTYWYLATVTANGKTVATSSQKYVIEVKRGIGPMNFLYGDDRLGFLGQVPYEELWSPQQMPAGFLSMFPNLLTDRVAVYKFSRNGKMLYLMSNPSQFPGFANWSSLYQAGLVYGTDDFGPAGGHGTLPDTKQDAKIIHNGDTYRMRLVRGITSVGTPAAFPFNDAYNAKDHDAVSELTGSCEFNDLFYTLVDPVPNKQRWGNWNALSYTYIGRSDIAANQPYYLGGTLCMEHDTVGDRVLHRGIFSTSSAQPVSVIQRINYVSPSQQGRYLPVFELVE
ncbi:putative virion structural protein [Erwinia phage vB_EamM_ChrisDB]|uniref:putative virion structural protein n=1 Tax=Erwinia phage vB_EamM_ChrisDB TaxID=1883371 RepID=UPI00081CC3E5|nr:putative virion structural protein [Erwinia phage vB_EamM_ChrisDB]ANZ48725.1 putative virion structural protein [Erwinia phage vB_EamM_ChrisDB]